ncbi:cellulase family glycosylhydrolase [Cryptosporangium aurantiacum]|uniref:Cellulase (Glycosyl hydrolase family 5) n=1 Tax=Cryptosporangium aurantiacum TaxID=134849 RepID=A0A1M7JN44_9ACTN|nr:cellulase family glycosylhydrolase [Cryptosporangium aurantiacum]SHM54442.1 Cellulase (glycosyl hydrolase family 5) [Cryptosporangium aurantiacum]
MKRKFLVASVLAVSGLIGGAVGGTAQAATTALVTKPTADASAKKKKKAVGVAGSATALAAGTAAAPAVPQLGVQMHAMWEMYWNGQTPNAMFDKHLNALAANKVQIVRVDMGWSASQPTSAAPTTTSWHNQRLNTVINRIRAKGMKVFLTAHQSPLWARPGTGSNTMQFPANAASIKPWMTFLAKNYGSRLAGIEVWNEPNLAEFTGVSDSAARVKKFVAVLKAAYAGINAGNAALPVIFGGPAQTDDVFIKQAYAAGAKGAFDIMALHPYQGNQTKAPESTDITGKGRMTNLPAVVAAMKANGDSAKPIWWTEFGTSVHSNAGINQVWLYGVANEQISGDYMVRSFKLAAKQYPQVKVGTIYTAYRPAAGISVHQYGYRLLEADGTVKGQLKMLKAMRDTTPSR